MIELTGDSLTIENVVAVARHGERVAPLGAPAQARMRASAQIRCPNTSGPIIVHIFYLVATSMPEIPRHSQAKVYPSELVTIGILFALKGGYFRAFYRWLKRDYGTWFGDGLRG